MRLMNYFSRKMLPAGGCLLLAAVLLAPHARAQSDVAIDDAAVQAYSVSELKQRYPENSIQSSESATGALADAKQARTYIEARYEADRRACYSRFFMTSCLDKASERRHLDLLQVTSVEVEANAYVRRARVVERDRKLAEKAAQDGRAPPPNPLPEAAVIDPDKAAAEAAAKEKQRKERAQARAEKVAQHAEKQRQLQEKEASDAQKRADNIEKYEAKVRASEARQKEIAKKKAEKQLKQQQHPKQDKTP
jgi:hypothetical protein